jgi:hypothetical protein
MIVVIGCEHSPLFLAYQDDEGLLTMDFTVMESVLEWHNSLSKSADEAYYQEDADVFCFPTEDDWEECPIQSDMTYLAPDWLEVQPACPECLNYVPCDCDFRLVDEPTLLTIEACVLTGSLPSVQDIRDMVYTIRELEAQLEVEQ